MKIITNKLLCTGCTACKSSCLVNAINMIADKNGFVYPEINEKMCINCGRCRKVCPINICPEITESSEYYAAINKDTETRLSSTSGGIFSLLAEYILNLGGKIYGAAYAENMKVIHTGISSMEKLGRLRSAKYSQSDLGETFREVKKDLMEDIPVLFSGTPCQVAGLKTYLEKDYQKLLLVDLVCHGVPSPKAWQEYILFREKRDRQTMLPTMINLRNKSSGWSHYGYSVSFEYPSGCVYLNRNQDDLFMRSFISNVIIRPSCNACHFKGVHRCSDITLGDFWGIWDVDPEMDDNQGTSLVLVHSDIGRKIWEEIRDQCFYTEVGVEDTYRQNPALIQSAPTNRKRDEFFDKIEEESFDVIEKDLKKNMKIRKKSSSALKKIIKKMFKM